MQCVNGCGGYRHEGPCPDPVPSQLEMLREAKNVAAKRWFDMIRDYPPANLRSREQQAEIEEARVKALAARDIYREAGGI